MARIFSATAGSRSSSLAARDRRDRLRAERLSASLGHVTHWPVYRFEWQEVGSLHRRFKRCNAQVGAEPFPSQSEAYRNLEYFLSYMSNGLELNGPASRK